MNGEILFFVIAGILLLWYTRRFLLLRSIRQYSPDEVEEKTNSGQGVLLLDIRTNKEWSEGHLKGAHHIPLHELARRISELEKHKNREVICYCRTGNRSLTAALRLKRLGFNVSHMRGGLAEWNFRKLK